MCEHCRAEFHPRRSTQIFCSRNCRLEKWKSVYEKGKEALKTLQPRGIK